MPKDLKFKHDLGKIRHQDLIDKINYNDVFRNPLIQPAIKPVNQRLTQSTHNLETFTLQSQIINNTTLSGVEERKNRMYKEMCGLCHHYYDKDSVIYVVPNYRIQELRDEWNLSKFKGKRYEISSYKYSISKLCYFCAQFFDDNEEIDQVIENSLEDSANVMSTEQKQNSEGEIMILDSQHHHEPKYQFFKSITRTDLLKSSLNSSYKCYQSSTVDNYLATNPIFLNKLSKTRRQVDPFWEVDFNGLKNIHSIEFDLFLSPNQLINGYILLFDKPIGFEDPFIDR